MTMPEGQPGVRVLRPRSTAQAYTIDELSLDQQQVYIDVVDRLVVMASELDERPQHRLFDPTSSRVLLINGDRGAGKTATMRSIVAHLYDPSTAIAVDASLPIEGGDRERVAARRFERWRKSNALLNIVPLTELALHSLPSGSPLLHHVIARLDAVVERHAPREPRFAQHGVRDARRDDDLARQVHEAKKALSQLGATAAQALDGVGHRTGDALSHALAQQRAAGAWHEIDAQFDRAIEAVSAVCGWKSSADAGLFVLPVDDADMEVRRLVELLVLVQSVSNRRFAVLLTGFSELFLHKLSERFGSEMNGSDRAHGQIAARRDGDAVARALAFDYFDRVVPPDQRFVLESIAPSKRVAVFVNELKREFRRSINRDAASASERLESHFRAIEKLFDEHYLPRALPDRRRGLENVARLVLHDAERLRQRRGELSEREFVAIALHRVWRTAVHRLVPVEWEGARRSVLLDVVTTTPLLDLRVTEGSSDDREASASQGRDPFELLLQHGAVDTSFALTDQRPIVLERGCHPVVSRALLRRVLRLESARTVIEGARIEDVERLVATLMVCFDWGADDDRTLWLTDESGSTVYDTECVFPGDNVTFRVSWGLGRFAKHRALFERRIALEKHFAKSTTVTLEALVRYVSDQSPRVPEAEREQGASHNERRAPAQFAVAAQMLARELRLTIGRGDRLTPENLLSLLDTMPTEDQRFVRSELLDKPMFYCPEAGLSVAVSTGALGDLFEQCSQISVDDEHSLWSLLRVLWQRERVRLLYRALEPHLDSLRAALPSSAQGALSLSQIVDEYDRRLGTSHPWFELVTRSGEPSETVLYRELSGRLGSYLLQSDDFREAPSIANFYWYFEGVFSRDQEVREWISRCFTMFAPLVDLLADPRRVPRKDGYLQLKAVPRLLSKAILDCWQNGVAGESVSAGDLALRADRRLVSKWGPVVERFDAWDLATARVCASSQRFEHELDGKAASLPAHLELLLRIARDLDTDGFIQLAAPTFDDARTSAADPLLIRHPSRAKRHVRWRAPSWPSLFDREAFEEYWRHTVSDLREKAPPMSDEQIVDILAFALINGQGNVAFRRKVPTGSLWRRPMQPATLARAAEALFAEDQVHPSARAWMQNTPRWRTFQKWRDQAMLIASPGAGMSHEGARALLDVFVSKRGLVTEQGKQSAREARLYNIGYAKDAREAMAKLHEIDRLPVNAGGEGLRPHPWIERFGAQEAPPPPTKTRPARGSTARATTSEQESPDDSPEDNE